MTHTRLVFLRHGRTEWNNLGKLQGQADTSLDEVGVRQAEGAARFFADWSFAACYSSDRRRALSTAEIVAAPHGLEVVPDARLQEINVGTWSGKTSAEVSLEMPDFVDLYTRGIDFRRSATGETLAEMTARALPAVREIAERHEGQRVLIVSHGLLLANVIQALVGIGVEGSVLGLLDNVCYSMVGVAGDRAWVVRHNVPTA